MHRRNSLSIQFPPQQITSIQKRFNEFAVNGQMNRDGFKTSMGLLGIGQCQFLCDRIFTLITPHQSFDSDEFLDFLNTITFGSKLKKTKLSFDFLDRNSKGYIDKDDVEVIISEISFIWNFLTGQKISNEDSIKIICRRLGINAEKQISLKNYLQVYENEISWYDYFNNNIKTQETTKNPFNIDQIEEYLKLLHNQIENIILDLKDNDEEESQDFISGISSIKSIKGPIHVSSQQFKPKGDLDYNRQSISVYRASTLSKELSIQGSSKLQVATNKLQKMCDISKKLFPHCHQEPEKQTPFKKKKSIINITEPFKNRQNIVYFGHQNWNLMLNMMLGIRKALKSHFYIFQNNVKFNEEDLNCKYAYELIYKKNNKSLKAISQIFVDYTPKVFFYIRKYFKIENAQFLKSIGLQNLIGNMLMGNLSSLTDQTSQGKSGNFIYYTEDMRLIIKSIPKDQYKKFRQILNDYAEYVRENPETFLVHIYGLYKLKNKQTNRQIYFIVLNNFFSGPLKINERYDIKGSTYNRQTKKENSHYSENVILKDVDLMNNHERSFRINNQTKQKIYEQINKDANFLSQHNIIQYSLLVGIHKKEKDETFSIPTERYFLSEDKNEAFFFGIIDILGEYSTKKVLENHFFHLFNNDISCLAPEQYTQRFSNFIYKYIFSS